MSRHNETMGVVANPAQYYLEWNSEKAAFCYYDKDSSEQVPMKLPFKFLALKFMTCITGFNEDKKLGIYSNEVIDTRFENLRVSFRDNSPIATGLYSQIKNVVNGSGGKFTRSIYAMSTKGVIINIKLKGAQLLNFGTIEKFGKRWQDEWILVSEFESREHEGKPYTVPKFGFGGALSVVDNGLANTAYDIIDNYFVSKQSAPPVATTQAQARPAVADPLPASLTWSENDNDDLPF
ncbi:hypothetical protein [Telluribacter humicola]|uniref:hypothetical protein n=1 Tax=Telluribacter humicola TaxID=1720261 RepID=UPI001A975B5E|nr:hypothetical protein [Telluribacter humicola]